MISFILTKAKSALKLEEYLSKPIFVALTLRWSESVVHRDTRIILRTMNQDPVFAGVRFVLFSLLNRLDGFRYGIDVLDVKAKRKLGRQIPTVWATWRDVCSKRIENNRKRIKKQLNMFYQNT